MSVSMSAPCPPCCSFCLTVRTLKLQGSGLDPHFLYLLSSMLLHFIEQLETALSSSEIQEHKQKTVKAQQETGPIRKESLTESCHVKSLERIGPQVSPECVAVGRSEWALLHKETNGADPYPSANLSLKGGIIINHIKVY